MADAKIIAIIAAVVVVIAGIGAALVLTQDNDEEKDTPPTGTQLSLYGNANGDTTINSKDVSIVEKVLAGDEEYTLANYPLADANHNGKIDDEDVTITKALANRESTRCFVIAQLDEDDDTDYAVVEVKYPLRHVVSINAEVTTVLVQLGVAPYVAGYQASEYSALDLKPLKDAKATALDLTSTRTIKATSYQQIIDLDTSTGGIGAIFIYNTNALGTYKADFATAGIPVIHTKCTNPQDSILGYRTFGFLFGEDAEEQGDKIAEFTTDVIKNVSDKLKSNDITGNALTNALVLFMKTSIAEANSQYTYAVQEAGGNVINQQSGASTKLANAESILTFKNPVPDIIISFTTVGLEKLSNDYIVGTVWDVAKLSYLTPSPAYKTLTYVNASMSVPARIAYVAELLYPEIFKDFGSETWQDYVDEFMPWMNKAMSDGDYDVKTDGTFIITYADYKAAGGTN